MNYKNFTGWIIKVFWEKIFEFKISSLTNKLKQVPAEIYGILMLTFIGKR